MTAATDLSSRLAAARRRSHDLQAQGALLTATARRLVGEDASGFTVRGSVDGRTVRVRYHRGLLFADRELLHRVHVVVELADPTAAGPVPSLSGDRNQLLLAVLRAFDRVQTVVLPLPGPVPSQRG